MDTLNEKLFIMCKMSNEEIYEHNFNKKYVFSFILIN